MVMGYGNDGRSEGGKWEGHYGDDQLLSAPQEVYVKAVVHEMVGEGLPPSVHRRVLEHMTGQAPVALGWLDWSPEQAADAQDVALFDVCPSCRQHHVLASTIAMQMTYQRDEPVTLHLWCIKGHAWRWNAIEGRVIEPAKWQR